MKTQPWPLDSTAHHQILDSLRRRHFKWDIYHQGEPSVLPDVLVLSEQEHQTLSEGAEVAWAALNGLEQTACEQDWLEELAVPAALHGAIRGQYAAGAAAELPRVTRCDFHYSQDGCWHISEFNDDGPGGFGETVGLPAVLDDMAAEAFPGLAFKGDLKAALLAALKPYPRIGLVHASAYSADLQQVALLADWLRAEGHTAIIASPANLIMQDGQAHLFDQPVDALFRYFPGEWIAELPNLADWVEANTRLPIMNPLSAMAAQSKRIYARLDDEAPLDGAASRHVIPPSRLPSSSDRDQLLAERARWVIKGAFGRMGDRVRIGAHSSPEAWAEYLDQVLDNPDEYVLQEAFEPAPLWFSSGGRYATIGVYLVNGRFAGYCTRVGLHPIINHDASYVPTMVELS